VKTIDCLGYIIYVNSSFNVCYSNLKTVINTINPHSYCEAKKDVFYQQALIQSDILLPDGIGIVWAAKTLNNTKIKKIAGADLHKSLLEKINEERGKIFYMGSSNSTLLKIQERIKTEYPNIKVGIYSPPYKLIFSEEDNARILDSINIFKPDVLFVGMTAPKQEKWVHQHKDQIDAKIIASIGAVFDFYAGTVKRPSNIWIALGLEWFPRFLREPRRLWRRNFISTPLFIKDVLIAKFSNTYKKLFYQ
jgi:N-acetylglucosaminyldiphosphoundecaprenol N-acetyl-beta-D-mannosaminyltransferase